MALDTGEDDTQNTAENSYKNPKLWRRVRDREAEWLHQVAVRQEWAEARWRVFLSHIPLYDNNEWWCHDGRPKWEPILKDIAPDVMLAGHDHGWKLLPQTAAQPWPVLIGGGPSLEEATIMLVTADESALQARLLAAKDGTLLTEFKKSATVRP